MIAWFQSLTLGWTFAVVIGGFLAITVLLGLVVVRFVPQSMREQHNELAGFILAVIGVIYAVLLAFVTIGVWERFEQAEARTYDEASNLAIVYRDSGSFRSGSELRAALRLYAETVIKDEWPKMQDGERSTRARLQLEAVDRDVRNLPVTNIGQQDVHGRMLDALDRALELRDERLSMEATGINPVMWVVLFIGALVTVTFTYLFGFKRTFMQQIMVGLLSVLIGLVLFLTIAMDYPFRGGIQVGPDAFENALYVFHVIGS
ncbi:MAG: DUF4239 domain-containing protein [Candidatus Eremiobacteraeota bacterium]|nr:DUF4239 domain-containing protein [Candidatus Eremiobacteraeota bacterium]MBV8331530.1 DUF4239 domain-containing protein [Candidatus Eremiobacteraeota bacterium]MBV8434121.1 DUF4239 domain-containing protein [Candidatus Eremiobacteraeota bacterium]MBV8654632.1 DUF4239 domain-containing protein [Candidatus Eremiobacteraeota bacterium]MBV8723648.1 DUF4239 domain-containing protein [Candidatus Eremiobacteraeota bacterium]